MSRCLFGEEQEGEQAVRLYFGQRELVSKLCVRGPGQALTRSLWGKTLGSRRVRTKRDDACSSDS